jgi:predicted amidohydrolase YtcJ
LEVAAHGPGDDPHPGPPDLILTGAPIWTGVPGQARGEAIAVGGGRVVAVGSHSEVTGLAGRSTRVVDLPGRAIVPGVQDGHVHPLGGGLARVRCALYDLAGPQAYEQAIWDYSASHPADEWILGGGWSLDDFPGGTPHRSVLGND